MALERKARIEAAAWGPRPIKSPRQARVSLATALWREPRSALRDQIDCSRGEPIDATDDLQLALLHGRIEDRRGRFQLRDVVDHVLPDRLVEHVPALLHRSLCGGRDRIDQR